MIPIIYGWRSRRYPTGLTVWGRWTTGCRPVLRGIQSITWERIGGTALAVTAAGDVYRLI